MSRRQLLLAGLLLFLIIVTIPCITNFQSWQVLIIYLVPTLTFYACIMAIIMTSPPSKVMKILMKDCDPERFILEYDKYYSLNGKGRISPIHALNKFRGFIVMGNLEKAKNMLDQIEIDKMKTPKLKALYYLNFATYCLGIDNIEEAKKCLSNFYDVPLGDGQKLQFEQTLEVINFEIKYWEGNSEERKKILNELLEEATNKQQHIYYVYRAALIAISEGRTDEAKWALEIIINEGDESPILTLAKHELKRLTLWEILDEDCDPEKFIFEYDKFYGLDGKNRLTTVHLLNRFVGLSDTDRFGEAKDMLDQIDIDKIETPARKALYYLYLAIYHLNTDDVEGAKRHLSRFYDVPLSEERVQKFDFDYMLKTIIFSIKFKDGDLEGNREIHNSLLKEAKSKRLCVYCTFRLALIDIAEKKTDDARQALEKVISEGNKLHIVTLAKQELEKLSNED